jgi:hypothetical protein
MSDSNNPNDPASVKIEKSHNAMIQNMVLGSLLTTAYLSAPLVGIRDFSTNFYVTAMLAGFGVVNLPKLFGKPTGSVGGFTLLAGSAKYVMAAFIAGLNKNV